jgi:hypothetical protein
MTPEPGKGGGAGGDAGGDAAQLDAALNELRGILAEPDRRRAEAVEARLREVEQRTENRDELIAAIAPVLGDAIRLKIEESRDEMIEALYPIIGQLIGRAVGEAIRNLARTIDARMRRSLSPELVLRRARARVSGVPDYALMLRDGLPYRVTELFLIHRASGLLLLHLSNEPEAAGDSDLISGMLTAIHDFATDAFGRGQEGQLDEIQYGERRILIEASQHAYLAVVVDGIEPATFRAAMRERVMACENTYHRALMDYDGDVTAFSGMAPALRELLIDTEGGAPGGRPGLSRGQKAIVLALAAALLLCAFAACGGSALALRNALNRPIPAVMIVVTATPGPATATLTPTLTPAPTATATAAATATATATLTRVPVVARATRAITVRAGPAMDSALLELAGIGRVYRVTGRNAAGDWLQVCCTRDGKTGWVATGSILVDGLTADLPIVADSPTGNEGD